MNMREALFGLLMLTVGALAVRAHDNQVIGDLRVKAECAYHQGSDDGYNTGRADSARDNLGVLIRRNPDGSQEIVPHHINEDDPAWDCHTMGNKVCGKK